MFPVAHSEPLSDTALPSLTTNYCIEAGCWSEHTQCPHGTGLLQLRTAVMDEADRRTNPFPAPLTAGKNVITGMESVWLLTNLQRHYHIISSRSVCDIHQF